MSRLTDLIAQAKSKDAALGGELEREFRAISSRRAFGLNFERHRPESVQLPGRAVRRGDKVRILPPRGAIASGDQRLWKVVSVDGGRAQVELLGDEFEVREAAVEDLIVVAEFRDYIYPGLVSTGRVERGGDKPFHTVINAENFHALEALTFTHRGKIDVIYIDPPYNTGARDWKYNNDYVESEDIYRHSKWLAFMERRILVAQKLLNPVKSVLIVTIDEKEYLRLGLLLDQTFPDAKIQMITTVIKPGGTSRTKEFSRVEEYVYFVFFGAAELSRTTDNMLGLPERASAEGLSESDLWEGMIRRGIGVVRAQRPGQFYPIFIDPERRSIVDVGEPLAAIDDRTRVTAPSGLIAVWPIKDDLTEGFWQLSPAGLAKARNQGTVRVGSMNPKTGQWRIQYMKAKKAKAVLSGSVGVIGRDENGVVILDLASGSLDAQSTPRTVWNKKSHDASTGGAGLLNRILPHRKFPFAKSLYAVEDCLRFCIGDNPDAIVLDFFAGSGTTVHAVIRLNRQDSGRRQCISITNNEVAADEQTVLRQQGLRPGDAGWERWGICDYITKPRIAAAITGRTPEGDPIKGDYRFTDEFPMAEGFEENAEFFTLTYETPVAVSHNLAFERIAPLMWIRAGCEGRRLDVLPEKGWDVAETHGVLVELDQAERFAQAVRRQGGVRIAYVVTDDERRFQAIVRSLPAGIESVRLYESYLTNFRFSMGR